MVQFSLDNIEGILFDLDGVLFIGNRIIDGAVATIDYIKSNKLPCRFLTNTTTSSLDSLYQKVHHLGFNIKKNEIFSPSQIAVRYLRKKRKPSCYLILEEDTKKEFAEFFQNEENPDVIVIGHYSNRWDYDLLNKLFNMIINGAELLALHKGRFWQTEKGLTLDIGAFVAGLEYVTGRQATVIGKPSETFFKLALEDMNILPGRAMMIGDDIMNDIAGAQKTGLAGVLVKTGKYRDDLLKQSGIKPDLIIDSVASLRKFI